VPDPAAFRRYVQTSGAEFSVAKAIYVETNSGWFSDRTARYLASGKPVLVHDTGLACLYPLGAGLVTFRTPQEAADGAARIAADYPEHCRAARALAEEFFDSDKVLGRLLDEAGVAP
jgi:glycosyltransferase involved in cell wall biosynthesis